MRKPLAAVLVMLPLLFMSQESRSVIEISDTGSACMCEIPCQAGCCMWCEIWGPGAVLSFSMSATAVITSLTAATTAVVGWLELRTTPSWAAGFGKVTAEKQRQTASLRVFGEGKTAVQSQLVMQEQGSIAAEQGVPPANLTTSVTNGALLSEQGAIVRQKIAANDAAFMADFYAKKSSDPGVVIERHKPYCSQGDVDRGRCDKAVSPTMQNADLSVNTIINPGEGQYETMADDERDAGIAFVKNVVNPVPVSRFGAAQAGSAQAKAYEAALLTDQAALSMAAHSFNAIIGNRTRRHQQ